MRFSIKLQGVLLAATVFALGVEVRGHAQTDAAGQGQTSDIKLVPYAAIQSVEGRDNFAAYCAVCHGRVGDGRGMVVQRGFRQPPSYHIDRLRAAPIGHFYDVVTNGFGAMPSYSDQITPQDRLAIIAYIRALQLSQHASVSDVPLEKRGKLDSGGPQ